MLAPMMSCTVPNIMISSVVTVLSVMKEVLLMCIGALIACRLREPAHALMFSALSAMEFSKFVYMHVPIVLGKMSSIVPTMLGHDASP